MQHHLLFLSAGLPARRSGARYDLHFRHKMKSRKQRSHSRMWSCSAVQFSDSITIRWVHLQFG